MRKFQKKGLIVGSIITLLLVSFIIYNFYISKHGLETTYYTISSDQLEEDIRIVHLTDLHNSVFGDNNSKLIDFVSAESPDLIFITGDLVNSKETTDVSIATDLIEQLSMIAPVYFSYGNQENYLEMEKRVDIRKLFSEAGATVLEQEYVDIEVKGQRIRIGGIYGYCMPVAYAMKTDWEYESEYLMDFQNTDIYTILLCHFPVCWLDKGSCYDWNIDCIFSGHAHGGQIRIPFVGGLWAPDQGWFPGQLSGAYTTTEDSWKTHRSNMISWLSSLEYGDTSYYVNNDSYEETNLVLSRGLGNTDWLPRFNNVPEIVVLDIISNG